MSAAIYVERDDDVRSILARMERVQGGTVGIVVPLARTSQVSPISLRLFHRQAEALGLELALVTQDAALEVAGHSEGIPVFRSPAAYERAVRRRRSVGALREPATLPPGVSWATAAAASLILLLIVGVAVVFVPVMTIVVTPRTSTLYQSIRVVADPSEPSVDVGKATIPARRVMVVADAADQSVPGEGQPAGDGRARGLVTFTNRTQSPVEVAAGTYVSTASGVRFATEQSTSVPAGLGQSASAAVVAEIAGDAGNVPRLAINVVPSNLDAKVYVQNEDATAGGGIPGSRIITSVDRDRLLKRVADKAKAESEAAIRQSLGQGEVLLGQTLRFTPVETTFDGEVGQEAQTLAVRYRAEATALVVSADDLAEIGRQTWEPKPSPGFEVVPDSVEAGKPEVVSVSSQTATLSLPLQAASRAVVDTAGMEQLARGQSAVEAARLLSRAYDLAGKPKITFAPEWADRAYRVRVTVDLSAPLAAR